MTEDVTLMPHLCGIDISKITIHDLPIIHGEGRRSIRLWDRHGEKFVYIFDDELEKLHAAYKAHMMSLLLTGEKHRGYQQQH